MRKQKRRNFLGLRAAAMRLLRPLHRRRRTWVLLCRHSHHHSRDLPEFIPSVREAGAPYLLLSVDFTFWPLVDERGGDVSDSHPNDAPASIFIAAAYAWRNKEISCSSSSGV
jgi:hypothetical protein